MEASLLAGKAGRKNGTQSAGGESNRPRPRAGEGPGASSSAGSILSLSDAPGAPAGGAHPLIQVASFRETARLAALQTELRLLGDLASANAIQGLQPYLQIHSSALSADTVQRSHYDARFRISPAELRELLDRFCSDLETQSLATPSAMVVVAHQDDESIGAGARLCDLPDAMVVHVTDGAPRDLARVHRLGFATPEEYALQRREELLAAMSLAGVGPDRLICLGMPDGEATHRLVELSYAIAELVSAFGPEVVVTHPYEGGHTDHDAVAFAVHLACGILRRDGADAPTVLELTSYHYRKGRHVLADFIPIVGTEVRNVELPRPAQRLKKRMFQCFETQQDLLRRFPVDVERFRAAPRYVFTRPPHEGLLNYERHGLPLTGAEWRYRAQRALEHLRTDLRKSVSFAGLEVPALPLAA